MDNVGPISRGGLKQTSVIKAIIGEKEGQCEKPYGDISTDSRRKEALRDENWLSGVSTAGI